METLELNLFFALLAFNWNILELLAPEPKNYAGLQKTEESNFIFVYMIWVE